MQWAVRISSSYFLFENQWEGLDSWLSCACRKTFGEFPSKTIEDAQHNESSLGWRDQGQGATVWSGGRLSEVLALVPSAFDRESGTISLHTLKRRRRGIVRQVPLPPRVIARCCRVFRVHQRQLDPELTNRRLWNWSRTTAWRRVKAVMRQANIHGLQASPKGLRHSFGIHAVQSGVPLPLLQRWMGHASLKTTAIYLDVIGPEERGFAERMWVQGVRRDHR